MVAILIILMLIIILDFLVISIFFSNITLNIEKCDISYNDNYINGFYIKNFNLSIQIYFFKYIKLVNIKIYKNYIQIYKFKIKYSIEDKIKDNNELFDDLLKNIKMIRKNKEQINIRNLKPIINNFNLDLSFGTENALVTTFSVPTISFIVSLLLSSSIYKYKEKNYNYKITPKFINRNNFKFYLNTKLSFKTLRLLIFIKEYRKVKNLSVKY